MASGSSKQAVDLATNGFKKIKLLVMKSHQIANKPKYNKYKTYTDFTDVVANLQSKINVTINEINNFVTHDPKKKMKSNNKEYNTDNVIDISDDLLEKVHLNLDSASGVNDASNQMLKNLSTNTIVKVQLGDATLVGARNIVKPQLLFKDRIDNTDSLWMPRLTSKPNSIKQLTVDYVFNENGKLAGHANPYEVELTAFKPPSHFVNNVKNPSEFPKPKSTQCTPLTMVETESQLDQLIEHLKGVHILGVDLEHHSFRTYQGITCLMQISTEEGGDFIIDTLALREHIHKFNIIFTDPNKVKVFHDARSDVIWLQRDFGVYVVGLFDTYIAAVVLNKIAKSLKYLVQHYCNYTLDKQHQLTDWRVRPLPDELIEYARCDTHYIIYLYRCMKTDLIKEAGGESHLVNEVFTRGKSVCMQVYQKPVVTDTSHLTLYNFYKEEFNQQQMLCLKLLYAWRDEKARIEDESPAYILPNHMLIKVAKALPNDIQSLETYCSPMPTFLKLNIDSVHAIILSCREMPMEPVLYKKQTIGSAPPSLFHEEIHDLDENIIGDEISQGLSLKMIPNKCKPEITLFYDQNELDSSNATDDVKNSTVDESVQLFLTPYHRYMYYRWLSLIEEMREFEEKTARIAATCKDDKYLKTEVSDLMKRNRSVNERGKDTTTGNEVDVKSEKDKRNQKGNQSVNERGKDTTTGNEVNVKSEKDKRNQKGNQSVNERGKDTTTGNEVDVKSEKDKRNQKGNQSVNERGKDTTTGNEVNVKSEKDKRNQKGNQSVNERGKDTTTGNEVNVKSEKDKRNQKGNRSVNKLGKDTTTGNEVHVKSAKNKRNQKRVAQDPESEKAEVKKTGIYNVDNYNMFYTKPKYNKKARKN